MRLLTIFTPLLILAFLPASTGSVSSLELFSETLTVGRSPDAAYSNLQDAIEAAKDNALIMIESGTYSAVSNEFIDPMCGNCLDPATEVHATTGFRIVGKSLTIVGSGMSETE